MKDFLIVYGDGSVFDGRGGERPPARDVQVIVQAHPDIGWHTQSGSDYYLLVEQNGAQRWQGGDIFALFDYLLDSGLVLFGRTTTLSDFNRLMTIALELLKKEKQQKTGWLKGEKRPSGN